MIRRLTSGPKPSARLAIIMRIRGGMDSSSGVVAEKSFARWPKRVPS